MRNRLLYVLFMLALAFGACGRDADTLPSAVEIFTRHYAARGGIERLESVKTLHRMGEMRLPAPEGVSVAGWYETWQVFPDKIRTDIFLQSGGFFMQGFDGVTAWQIDDQRWRQELTGAAKAQLAAQATNANLEMQYLGEAQAGRAQVLGRVALDRPEFEGRMFYRVRLGEDSLNYQLLYVDTASALWNRKEVFTGGMLALRQDVLDWAFNGGIALPAIYEEYDGAGRPVYGVTLAAIGLDDSLLAAGSARFYMPDSTSAVETVRAAMRKVGAAPRLP